MIRCVSLEVHVFKGTGVVRYSLSVENLGADTRKCLCVYLFVYLLMPETWP
jgi:hypothetical protein